MEKDLSMLENFLREVSLIKYTKSTANIIQIISGSESHYEKYISNTLAFFLDAGESHKLGSLVLDTLLEAAGFEEKLPVYGTYTVERERAVSCGTTKYIDIFIVSQDDCDENEPCEGASWAVAIENKIYAGSYNPFNCYCSEVEKYMHENSKPPCILLSLNKMYGDKFANVTYSRLAELLRAKLNHFEYPSTKYTQLLIELFDHATFLEKGGSTMNKALVEFIWNEHDNVIKLYDMADEVKKHTKEKAKRVHSILLNKIKENYGEGEIIRLLNGWLLDKHNVWANGWEKRLQIITYFDFKLNDCRVAFDIGIFPNGGWELTVFSRKNENKCDSLFVHIIDEARLISIDGASPKERYQLITKTDKEASDEDIAQEVLEVIKKLVSAS